MSGFCVSFSITTNEVMIIITAKRKLTVKNENPLPIRENLLKYLSEDLEKTEQPLSEQIAKILKL